MAFMRQRYVKEPEKPKERTLLDTLAEGAVRTGLGFFNRVGQEYIGNIFAPGGEAELALTPQQTLDARRAKADAALQKSMADAAAARALEEKRKAETEKVPYDIESTMATTAKTRQETQLAPIREARKQAKAEASIMKPYEEREFTLRRDALLNANAIAMEDRKQSGRLALSDRNAQNQMKINDQKWKLSMKRLASQSGQATNLRGEAISNKQLAKEMTERRNLYNMIKDRPGNEAEAARLYEENQRLAYLNFGGSPGYDVNLDFSTSGLEQALKSSTLGQKIMDPLVTTNLPQEARERSEKLSAALFQAAQEDIERSQQPMPPATKKPRVSREEFDRAVSILRQGGMGEAEAVQAAYQYYTK